MRLCSVGVGRRGGGGGRGWRLLGVGGGSGGRDGAAVAVGVVEGWGLSLWVFARSVGD